MGVAKPRKRVLAAPKKPAKAAKLGTKGPRKLAAKPAKPVKRKSVQRGSKGLGGKDTKRARRTRKAAKTKRTLQSELKAAKAELAALKAKAAKAAKKRKRAPAKRPSRPKRKPRIVAPEVPPAPPAPAPEPPPPPPKPPAPESRVFIVRAAEPSGFSEKTEPDNPRVRVSGHGNRGAIGNAAEAFQKAFSNALKKTGFAELSDAPFFRFGVSFRVRQLWPDMERATLAIKLWLDANLPEGASAHIVQEDKALTIHVNLGSYEDATTAEDAIEVIKERTAFIREAMHEARTHSTDNEDLVWFPFWDWDDMDLY